MRIVVDTDVVYAGLCSNTGAARQLLNLLWPPSSHEWLLSVSMMAEYEAVLTRKSFLQAAQLTVLEVNEFLNALAKVIVPVHIDYHWRPLLIDADDDHIAETAINGDADAIVTFNQKDFKGLEKYRLKIFTPRKLLERIRL